MTGDENRRDFKAAVAGGSGKRRVHRRDAEDAEEDAEGKGERYSLCEYSALSAPLR